jgi:hypothetical protein
MRLAKPNGLLFIIGGGEDKEFAETLASGNGR